LLTFEHLNRALPLLDIFSLSPCCSCPYVKPFLGESDAYLKVLSLSSVLLFSFLPQGPTSQQLRKRASCIGISSFQHTTESKTSKGSRNMPKGYSIPNMMDNEVVALFYTCLKCNEGNINFKQVATILGLKDATFA
jgi:hypothetical protein